MRQRLKQNRPPPLPKQSAASKLSHAQAFSAQVTATLRQPQTVCNANEVLISEQISLAELGLQTLEAQETLASLGAVMSVFMRSNTARSTTLAQMEQLVSPAVLNGQCLLAHAHSKDAGMPTPIAAILWAKVSDAVDHRLSCDLDKPVQLGAKDWSSGNNPWLIAAAGENRFVSKLVKRLQTNILGGQKIKFRSTTEDGTVQVSTIKPDTMRRLLSHCLRDSYI
jgi:cytolysin-activating lysine-acyltransferase